MKILSLVLLLLFYFNAHSRVQPEEGLWDDPNKPGRGVNIELQNGVLVATYFGYDQQGNDQWWQGVGTEGPEGTWSGTLSAFNGGQCVGCDYQFPTVNDNESIGDFSIEFISSSKANLTWAEGTELIQKGNWGFGSPLDYLLGVWSFTGFGASPENDYGRAANSIILRLDGHVEIEGVEYVYGNYSGYSGDIFPVLAKIIGTREFNSNTILPEGDFISFLYQLDLIGLHFGRYDMIVNENKAEGIMITHFTSNPIPEPGGDASGFIRAIGAKLIDQYEKEQLYGTVNNKESTIKSSDKRLVRMAELLKQVQ